MNSPGPIGIVTPGMASAGPPDLSEDFLCFHCLHFGVCKFTHNIQEKALDTRIAWKPFYPDIVALLININCSAFYPTEIPGSATPR